jgi:ATP-dependent Clp protease ATP-binding subunit ClpC
VYPFERFSDDAKQVLVSTQKEAEQARRNYIGTEHLLLGLLQVESEARRLLRQLGVDEERTRSTISSALVSDQRVPVDKIVPTSRVKKVIELSFAAAQREQASHVTPQHLLIGLMEEGEGIAAHVLQDLGVTLEAILPRGPETPEDR